MFGLTDKQLDLYNLSLQVMMEETYLPEHISKINIMVDNPQGHSTSEMEEEASFTVQDIVTAILFECTHASYWYLEQRSISKKSLSQINRALTIRIENRLYMSLINYGVYGRTKDINRCAKDLSREIVSTYEMVMSPDVTPEQLYHDLWDG